MPRNDVVHDLGMVIRQMYNLRMTISLHSQKRYDDENRNANQHRLQLDIPPHEIDHHDEDY